MQRARARVGDTEDCFSSSMTINIKILVTNGDATKIARRAFRAFEGYGLRIMPRRLLINNKKPSLSHLHWRDHAMIWQSPHSPQGRNITKIQFKGSILPLQLAAGEVSIGTFPAAKRAARILNKKIG